MADLSFIAWENVLGGSAPMGFREPSGSLKLHLAALISERVG